MKDKLKSLVAKKIKSVDIDRSHRNDIKLNFMDESSLIIDVCGDDMSYVEYHLNDEIDESKYYSVSYIRNK